MSLSSGDTSDLRGGVALEVAAILENDFGVNIPLDDLCAYMGIRRTNSVGLQDQDRLGSAVYPLFSMMNHSCRCNTRRDVNSEGVVYVRAQVPINAGQEV